MTDEESMIAEAVQSTRKRRSHEDVEPEVEYMQVTIDVPPHAPDIRVDGRIYQPGMTYKVTVDQARTLKDIMFRAWAHEQEVRGQRTGFAPKKMNHVLRG